MFDFQDFVVAAIGVLAALPTAYFSAKKQVVKELAEQLRKVSGGAVASVEDLVAETLRERRLREGTPITVYGDEDLWRDVRKGNFLGASLSDRVTELNKIAVVDPSHLEGDLSTLHEPYLLIYKEGQPYRGSLPPGAQITFANSSITLDARLMEALRHMHARG